MLEATAIIANKETPSISPAKVIPLAHQQSTLRDEPASVYEFGLGSVTDEPRSETRDTSPRLSYKHLYVETIGE